MAHTFRSLRIPNYRTWAYGALVSNIGTWMQRTAQDWLVLTELTDHNATAVGIVLALQFGPQLLMLPLSGWAADTFDRRRLLLVTQTLMALLALGLGLLTVAGTVTLGQVYLFAFGLGCVAAFDAPARQTFVSDLVGDEDLPNAVALNSTSFNAARLLGPAAAGLLIVWVGIGGMFLLNAASYLAVLFSLLRLRPETLRPREKASSRRGSLLEGFRYIWVRPQLVAVLAMVFLLGTFSLNFPIFLTTMSASVFGLGAREFGLLSSGMAVGSVSGALLAASRSVTSMRLLVAGSSGLGLALALGALTPNPWTFGLTMALVGVTAQLFNSVANSMVQLTTSPGMRGRVMAIFMAVAMGGTPLGAPIVGWVSDGFGPRFGLAVAGLAALLSAAVGASWISKHREQQPN